MAELKDIRETVRRRHADAASGSSDEARARMPHSSGCCETNTLQTCCEPEDKAHSCGDSVAAGPPSRCGCTQ